MFTDKAGLFGSRFNQEPFQVVIILFCIEVGCRPDLPLPVLFDDLHIIFKMAAEIEIGGPEVSRFGDDHDLVLSGELSQEYPPCVCIQPHNILVEPDLPPTQGRYSFLLNNNFLDREFGQDISIGTSSFDGQLGKIKFKNGIFQPWSWSQVYLDYFRFSIGIGAEVENLGMCMLLANIVLLISCYPGYRGTFHHYIS